jgi:putative membrane protein insertion efficiency factor
MAQNNILVKLLVWGITAYQCIISPMLPKVCRFYPTCSEYAKQALLKYGLIQGSVLSIRRILRCHPFCEGGYDPVDKIKTEIK